MAERRRPGARDLEASAAQRVGARDLHVGRHPVVRVGLPLLGGQERQQGSQRVDREGLARRETQVLAGELEIVPGLMVAHHRAVFLHDLHAQVVERELVVGAHVASFQKGSGERRLPLC